jgi:hypothetical protein
VALPSGIVLGAECGCSEQARGNPSHIRLRHQSKLRSQRGIEATAAQPEAIAIGNGMADRGRETLGPEQSRGDDRRDPLAWIKAFADQKGNPVLGNIEGNPTAPVRGFGRLVVDWLTTSDTPVVTPLRGSDRSGSSHREGFQRRHTALLTTRTLGGIPGTPSRAGLPGRLKVGRVNPSPGWCEKQSAGPERRDRTCQ